MNIFEKNDENSAQLWQRTRGWDDINYVTPHGWTAAELFLLLRDCLVREEGDELIIGSGIPKEWLNQDFQVCNMPTYFGNVSFCYYSNQKELHVKAPNIKVTHQLPESVQIVHL